MKKEVLSGAVGYLAGPITCADDDGITWRKELKDKMEKTSIQFFDPTEKPKKLGSDVLEKHKVRELKLKGHFRLVTDAVKKYRRQDLRMVDTSNFLIVYVDTDIFTMGTFDELFTAEEQRKPIFAIVRQGKNKAPDWLFAVVKHQEIFNSVDNLVEHLKELNSGKKKLDKRWVLLH